MNVLSSIEGTVEEIIYFNELNGYTVCSIRDDSSEIIAVGYMPFINAGEILKIEGKWVLHPDYGQQFKVEMYEKKLPQSIDAIEKYLASGVVKGIGPVTASRIVERFGADALNVLQYQPEQLTEIKGISRDKAIKIGQAFEEQRELLAVSMFLQKYGVSPAYSAKIYKAFGDRTIDEIKANPYRLSDEAFGLGFKTADKIAESLGIDPSSKYRVISGIKYVLTQATQNGHTYLPEDKLKELASQLLNIELTDIEDSLFSLAMDKSVFIERDYEVNRVYLASLHTAELSVCKKLYELSQVRYSYKLDELDEALRKVQQQEGIELAERQKNAIKESIINGVTVITGGPGTGKTTIIKSIIMLLNMEGYRVTLAAPTGRAAKRMTEATGYEARTIHRVLEIGYSGENVEPVFIKNEANPIDTDVVIIDEMSMVDILIMNNLLKAVSPGTRLVLVGDVDQLPSVGPGKVLKDIIESGTIAVVKLTEIFRQAEESLIVVNAHRINNGEPPYIGKKDKDFFFLRQNSQDSMVETIVDLCGRRIPDSYGYDPIKHIQVLSPMKKGITGVHNLNVELQKILNPPARNKNEKVLPRFTFREGDRVMQIRNNYELRWERAAEPYSDGNGVFNGDTGLIQKIDDKEQKIIVLFEDDRIVEYDYSILDEIEPAFAITIHKSQGSEFPVVIMPVFQGP
ncbi:MAG: ATP-dependent RecD-like DNA helicase, partial [Bacillota bacterium]|nr:ATP-dependent RecD-like DNA helicase [Bacillota bacterium]